jgi:hypothetical protein
METYRTSFSYLAFSFAVLIILTAIGIYVLVFKTTSDEPEIRWFVVFWLSCLGWSWYKYTGWAFETRLLENNRIEFRSLRGRKLLALDQIESIEAFPLAGGCIRIRSKEGTLKLVGHIDKFHELIFKIRSQQPSIDIKGL